MCQNIDINYCQNIDEALREKMCIIYRQRRVKERLNYVLITTPNFMIAINVFFLKNFRYSVLI